jgi:hypothetical protein
VSLHVQAFLKLFADLILVDLLVFLEFYVCFDVVIEVIKLCIFILNISLNLLFLSYKCLLHSLSKVGGVSMLSDEILLVSDDVWELGGHDLGVGQVRSATSIHGTETVGFGRLLKCFFVGQLFKADIFLDFVDH